MKHIVIDARLYGPKHTGIGRYTKNLLIALSKLPDFNKYKFTLIVYKDLESEVKKDLGNKFNYISTDIAHYSLKEQLLLPFLLYRLKADLVHFTHFNKPIFYFGKSVVTVHDLIKHFFKGKETTTKNPSIYWLKHLSYLFLINIVIKSSKIIVPSNFWREYLIKNFKVKSKDITTTHEAVDPKFLDLKLKIIEKPENYIVYTGNLYPHKNIKIILLALTKLPKLKLKIICSRNYFSEKLEVSIKKLKLTKQVEFLGYVDDTGFQNIYSKALALVHPSLMEGFSLTGLEAMALNCPVISSNLSCLPEIYQDSVLYFNPYQAKDLIDQIQKLQKSLTLRSELIKLGHKQLLKYSWTKTAKLTLEVYQKTI
ncbi:MAG: glycosyltransferase family 1 protein [Candidatus Shapirobacteria bacterium]